MNAERTRVKLTRRQRLEIFRQMKAAMARGDAVFKTTLPEEQLEAIAREFSNFPPQPKPEFKPHGIMGDKWYCEAGCGTVIATKTPDKVFKARVRGTRTVCKPCLDAYNAAQKKEDK